MRRRTDAAVAVSRFGLGPQPAELDAATPDPEAWLRAQLSATPEGPAGVRTVEVIRETLRARRGGEAELDRLRRQHRRVFREELAQRTLSRIASPAPFFERWVAFWSEHFTVSVRQPRIFAVALAFEREAIRPNALGSFGALLRAAVRHPAMLIYLDNQRSVGEDSPIAELRGAGLNENLAREILELHTLGVDGGYSQRDVIALAQLITGWSVDRHPSRRSSGFRFYPEGHAEGAKELLGETFDQGGYAEGEAALEHLARHPSTARHVAQALATHFVSDAPSASAVSRLQACFLDTGGDLRALAEAVLTAPEAWQQAEQKLRRPEGWLVACCRAAGLHERVGRVAPEEEVGQALVAALADLGHVPFAAPSPAGWPDEAGAWAGGEALLQRVEVAERLARHLSRAVPDAAARAEALWGPRLSRRTARALAGSAEPASALALLFASPEMMRR